jgi:hypothetical protein
MYTHKGNGPTTMNSPPTVSKLILEGDINPKMEDLGPFAKTQILPRRNSPSMDKCIPRSNKLSTLTVNSASKEKTCPKWRYVTQQQ